MSRFFARVFAVVFGVSSIGAVAAGCSSSSYSFSDEYCSALAPCCSSAGLAAPGSTCRQLLASSSGDESKQKACVDATKTAVAGGKYCQTLSDPAVDAACKGLTGGSSKAGTTAPGGACTSSSECSADGEGHCENQKCQIWKVGAAGSAPCIGTKSGNTSEWSGSVTGDTAILCDATQGLYCDFGTSMGTSMGGTCKARQMAGGPCTGSSTCVDDAYCDFTSSTCKARLSVGAACMTSGGSDTCAATAYCDGTTKVCTPRLADGAACDGSSQCLGGECLNGKCKSSSGLGGFALAFVCGG
jgi:hypothetical protein